MYSRAENWPLEKRDELADWFSRQERIVSTLIELALQKRCLLMNPPAGEDGLNKFNEIIEKESRIMLNLQEVEQMPPEISRKLTKAPVEPELADRCAVLRSDLGKLRRINEENKILLGSLLQYINFFLDLFYQEKTGGIYRESPDKSGEVEKVVARPGQFDCQV